MAAGLASHVWSVREWFRFPAIARATNNQGILWHQAEFSSGSPAIGSDGTAYLVRPQNLLAVSPEGKVKWTLSFGEGRVGWQGSPVVDVEGTVFAGSADRHVYAVRPSGEKLWEFDAGDPIHSSPAIGPDGTLYIGTTGGKLYALWDGSRRKK